MLCSKLLLPASLLLVPVSSWNTDVHNQIGFLAEAFLTSETTETLQHFIEPIYNDSIGRAAAWADAYAHTSEGRFSYQWHWIDTHDAPPHRCELEYERDCAKGGCVTSAIANQTEILSGCIRDVLVRDKGSSVQTSGQEAVNKTCAEALKWIVHFTGDIHQPLHASGRAAGGNFYKVRWGTVSTELHAIWDGYIPYYAAKVAHPFSNTTISPYFTTLLTRIQRDLFWEPAHQWTVCTSPRTSIECATRWARESNRWTCDYVYKRLDGEGEKRNATLQDLTRDGYEVGAVPIVELQIAKAAVRLGAWLNGIVEGVKEERRFNGVIESEQKLLDISDHD